MNTLLRLTLGMALLLSLSVFTAWAWDRSDAPDAPAKSSPALVGSAQPAG